MRTACRPVRHRNRARLTLRRGSHSWGSRVRRSRFTPCGSLAAAAHELRRPLQDLAQFSAHIRSLTEPFSNNVPHAGEHVIDAVQILLRSNQAGSTRRQIGRGGIRLQDFTRQRFQTALPRQRGERLLLWLERQIQILETLGRIRQADLVSQFGSQNSLRFEWT